MKDVQKEKHSSETVFTITNGKLSKQSDQAEASEEPADFETAISATKFGKFNFLLLLVSLPAGWTAVFDTSVMSYVFPAAQCDLSLTLVNKGTLNAIIYAGMITSAFFWGYLADTLGRKQILVYGYFIDAICNICCSFSQSFWMLIFFKFISGFIVSGPFAVLMAYLSEFHAKKIRSRVIISTGISFSTANCVLPLMAWWIIPQKLDYKYKSFEIHSWNLFILISSVPVFLAAMGCYFLPESPKFLMTTGRNDEAMEVFKKVYSMNTGKPPDTFPIKKLVKELGGNDEENGRRRIVITANRSKKVALKEGFKQIRPLFYPPYLSQIILVFCIYFGLLLGMNTLRLWLPQLFATMDEYQQLNPENTNATLCEMLEYSLLKQDSNNFIDSVEECFVVEPNDQVYINSIIVACSTFGGYILVAVLVDFLGKKVLICVMLLIGGSAGLANYWSQNWIQTLAFSATHVALIGISCTTLISAIVELFPTSLRTMTISLAMMCGRIGSIIGNLIFPILLTSGCLQPFLLVGGIVLVCSFATLGLRSTIDSPFQ